MRLLVWLVVVALERPIYFIGTIAAGMVVFFWVPDISRNDAVLTNVTVEAVYWEAPDEIGWVVSFCRHRTDAKIVGARFEWRFQSGERADLHAVERIPVVGEPVVVQTNLQTLDPACPIERRFRTQVPTNGRGGDSVFAELTYRMLWGWSWWKETHEFGGLVVPPRPNIRVPGEDMIQRQLEAAQPELRILREESNEARR